ncbi:hypothetical protein ACFQRD_09970 [Brachybacterium sp. GCM10030268]|uniref:hypothetical protein n=1 Tax=Brachybacterium sp. GCM10030268 TaxID=3273382 RepID=UPI00360605BE
MLPFMSGLPGMSRRQQPQRHPLLDDLVGQTVIHTRVAARGTWTVTARGWVLHSRIQQLDDAPVGLRDPRLLAATVNGAEMLPDGHLTLALTTPTGPQRLTTVPRWEVRGPRGARLRADEKGVITADPPGPPVHATPEALAAFAASRPGALEQRLQDLGRRTWLHPGHVVEVMTAAGALDDQEFERRGPTLLARMLARGEIRAGFVTDGRFAPWDLPLADVIEHIFTVWQAVGGSAPGQDMIAWFELTTGRDTSGPTSAQAMPPGMSGYDSPGVVGGFR